MLRSVAGSGLTQKFALSVSEEETEAEMHRYPRHCRTGRLLVHLFAANVNRAGDIAHKLDHQVMYQRERMAEEG